MLARSADHTGDSLTTTAGTPTISIDSASVASASDVARVGDAGAVGVDVDSGEGVPELGGVGVSDVVIVAAAPEGVDGGVAVAAVPDRVPTVVGDAVVVVAVADTVAAALDSVVVAVSVCAAVTAAPEGVAVGVCVIVTVAPGGVGVDVAVTACAPVGDIVDDAVGAGVRVAVAVDVAPADDADAGEPVAVADPVPVLAVVGEACGVPPPTMQRMLPLACACARRRQGACRVMGNEHGRACL